MHDKAVSYKNRTDQVRKANGRLQVSIGRGPSSLSTLSPEIFVLPSKLRCATTIDNLFSGRGGSCHLQRKRTPKGLVSVVLGVGSTIVVVARIVIATLSINTNTRMVFIHTHTSVLSIYVLRTFCLIIPPCMYETA